MSGGCGQAPLCSPLGPQAAGYLLTWHLGGFSSPRGKHKDKSPFIFLASSCASRVTPGLQTLCQGLGSHRMLLWGSWWPVQEQYRVDSLNREGLLGNYRVWLQLPRSCPAAQGIYFQTPAFTVEETSASGGSRLLTSVGHLGLFSVCTPL